VKIIFESRESFSIAINVENRFENDEKKFFDEFRFYATNKTEKSTEKVFGQKSNKLENGCVDDLLATF
jgi:hypothetical protein